MAKQLFLMVMLSVMSCSLVADCFQDAFFYKKAFVMRAIGARRTKLIEQAMATSEIYRITQLLEIPSIGTKTVVELAAILGYWFEYRASTDVCLRARRC